MLTHNVKSHAGVFADVWNGLKRFEVRKDDRGYCVGDRLIQQEYLPDSRTYTGRYVSARITYKLAGGQWGIQDGYCVLGLDDLQCRYVDKATGAHLTPVLSATQ